MDGPPVTFNYITWATRYPELAATVPQPTAQAYFDEAGAYCDNTACSPVQNPVLLSLYLNMLTAHIAALNSPLIGQPQSSPLVGRISNASEGSVSVQTQNDYLPGTQQWYQQTKYGSAFWAATGGYRMALRFPTPDTRVPFDPSVPWPLGGRRY